MKNFLWGVLLFLINVFMLYQNYTKNFTFSTVFFIEANQMMAFLIGLIYSQQCRRFDLKQILGVASNSLVFSILTTFAFASYGAEVSFNFTLLLFMGIFICMFISFGLYYWLFCPEKYKKRFQKKKYLKEMAKRKKA